MRTLTTHKRIDEAGGAEKHEGKHAKHEENGEALRLPDKAAFVSHSGGAGENGGWKRGNHGQTMMVRIFLITYHTP